MQRCLIGLAIGTLVVGCMPHWLAPKPQVRLAPEPGVYGEPIFVEPDGDEGDRYFATIDPDASRQEFVEFFGEYIRRDVDFRIFVISASGVQSKIERVRYVIEGNGPMIDSPTLQQSNVSHFSYDLSWNAQAVEDDTTPFEALEFTVVSSETGPLTSWADAEDRGRVEHGWSVYSDIDPSMTVTPGPITYTYTSSFAGDARWMSVFVRDEDRNVTGFGSVYMTTWPGPASVYSGHGTANDTVFLNTLTPGSTGAPAFSEVVGPPPSTATTIGVELGDISGDGLSDLAAVYEESGTVYAVWVPGNGDGTFAWTRRRTLWQESSATALPERDIYVADLNQDGKSEVIVPTATAGVHVYRADGSRATTLSGQAARLAFGDFDGNGEADIAGLLPGTAPQIRIWLARNGSYNFVQQLWGPPSGSNNLAAGDLDGDGYDDLLIANPVTLTDPSVEIYWGSATGYLQPELAEPWGADGTADVAVLDYDFNGTLDLVFANEWSIGSNIYTNMGDGTFVAGTPVSGESGVQVEVADVTGDGNLEVIERVSDATNTIRYFVISGGNLGTALSIDAAAAPPNDIAVGALR